MSGGGRPLWQVAGKRDPDQEYEAQQWIEAVLGERFPPGYAFEDVLRDGIVLCRLVNKLAPGIIQKINYSGGDYKMMDNINLRAKKMAACRLLNIVKSGGAAAAVKYTKEDYKMMDNINAFQKACIQYGVPDTDLFQSVDLWECKNIAHVTMTIFALGRTAYKHPEWRGPYLGPRPSEEHKRDFTEQQLRAGETIIGLQAGTNKKATQSGQSFGATRKILLGK